MLLFFAPRVERSLIAITRRHHSHFRSREDAVLSFSCWRLLFFCSIRLKSTSLSIQLRPIVILPPSVLSHVYVTGRATNCLDDSPS
jgi:hypothetical protein